MSKYDSNTVRAFFELLRAGLWGRGGIQIDGPVDWKMLYKLAMEQTVAGYVAAGLELYIAETEKSAAAAVRMTQQDTDKSGSTAPASKSENKYKDNAAMAAMNKITSDKAVRIAVPDSVRKAFNAVKLATGMTNFRMNDFLAKLTKELNEAGIEQLLLKGQGVAQNYLHPEIRQAGDIDLLLQGGDYDKARALLEPKADKLEKEGIENKHLGMHFGNIEVELHGTINSGFGKKINAYLAGKQNRLFAEKKFRYWRYNDVYIALPSADFDALFIFTHFLQHFYHGGLGLRQICDWAMHLHKNNKDIDRSQLQSDIQALGLIREWQTFGCFAIKYLGLPEDEMPMFNNKYYRNSDKIRDFLFASGNFGRSKGRKDYSHNPYLVRKLKSLYFKGGDILGFFLIFPKNTIRFFFTFLHAGLKVAAKGE